MASIDLIRNSVVTCLSDGSPFSVVGDDGWGMAPVERLTDRGPLQHGDSDYDLRLKPRIGRLKLLFNPGPREQQSHWDLRATLLRLFRPTRSPLKLRWSSIDGKVRQIDVHYLDSMGFGSSDRMGYSQAAVIELRAADPTFYDPTVVGYTFGVNAGTTGWAYPITFPEGFGSSTVAQTRAITYNGTWRTSPIVTIKGPVTNPVITNMMTGDKLDFTGLTIGSGTTYTIDCRAGVKTVLDQLGASQIANLTDDSDLATFSLEAEAVDGINTIAVTGSAANATTEVYLQYYERYIGI